MIFGVVLFYRVCYVQPLLSGQQAAVVEIAPGKPLRTVASDLAQRGILLHPLSLILLARLRGEAGAMRAGEYR
ncbi:MAG: hypothetical protein ACRESC_03065, partial [Gammaproteobacteria bacterium]